MDLKDRQEIQRIWDTQLIGCWRHFTDFNNLLLRFFIAIEEIDLYQFCEGVEEIEYALDSFGLRRAKLHKSGGLPMKGTVRSFVAQCSPHLNNCLLAGVATDEEILAAIEGFEWRMAKRKSRHNKRHRNVDVRIRMRELDTKRNWNVVS